VVVPVSALSRVRPLAFIRTSTFSQLMSNFNALSVHPSVPNTLSPKLRSGILYVYIYIYIYM
jgi:hypothetical protein